MKTLTVIALLLLSVTALNAQEQHSYFPDGTVKETFWLQDGRTEFITYHTNGRVEERGAFVNGKPDGIWKHFDENGKVLTRVQFTHGLRNGRCLYTNIDGTTQYRLEYAQGKLVHGAELNGSGEVIAERGER